MKTIKLVIISLLTLLLILGAIGCTSKSTPPASQENTAEEQKKEEKTQTSDQAETPVPQANESEGEKLVKERCTVCHSIDRIEDAEYDLAGWNNTVDRMMGKGANLKQEERQKVVEYLSSR